MSPCLLAARRHFSLLLGLIILMGGAAPVAATPQQAAPPSAAPARWPCRLIIASDLRSIVELAWERSPTFRSQCEHLAEARMLVLLHRASSAQIQRQAQSQIGISADGTLVAQVLVRLNTGTVELIAHELEHVLEHLDGVDLAVKASHNRSGVTLAGDAYETERAIEAGQRVAREVRASQRAR
jgi:hypothetical protein